VIRRLVPKAPSVAEPNLPFPGSYLWNVSSPTHLRTNGQRQSQRRARTQSTARPVPRRTLTRIRRSRELRSRPKHEENGVRTTEGHNKMKERAVDPQAHMTHESRVLSQLMTQCKAHGDRWCTRTEGRYQACKRGRSPRNTDVTWATLVYPLRPEKPVPGLRYGFA